MLRGHPKGLYPLFFTEMWERLGFYTMVGILLLYTINTDSGGLGLPKVVGNEIYGLYLAFVYFTPYLGGLIADRFLGYRRSVFIGGICLAAGYFLMGVYGTGTFVTGLVMLCIGNGFFKPNISVMVGNLYEPGDVKRDAGFSVFYMGINIGAFAASFLAAVMRNQFDWQWTFRAAGIGMLVSLVNLALYWRLLEKADKQPEQSPDDVSFGQIMGKILGPAVVVGIAGYFLARGLLPEGSAVSPAVCGFLAGMIPIIVFFVRLGMKASPEEKPGLLALLPVYVAGATFFMILHLNGSAMTTWAKENTDRQMLAFMPDMFRQEAFPDYYSNAPARDPRPNRLSLLIVAPDQIAAMYGQQRMDESSLARIEADHGDAVRIFILGEGGAEGAVWARYGTDIYSSVSVEETAGVHGEVEITVSPDEDAEKLKRVVFLRQIGEREIPVYLVSQAVSDSLYAGYREKFGGDPEELEPGEWMRVANSELLQSLNALFVVLFTPLVVAFFAFMMRRGRPVSTARKIFLGMVLTTLALLVMALGGFLSDNGTIKVSWLWLAGFYAIVSLGELCLSPMALSLVTKLSPARLVGLTMGGWFLATSLGSNLSGFFGGIQGLMQPSSFFRLLAGLSALVALFIFLVLPKLDAAIRKYGA